MKKIGFICTGNSARSQMAEGFGRYFAAKLGKQVEVYSAGSNPAGFVHPLAVRCMEEVGIDISGYRSKSLDDVPYQDLDIIITLCGNAAENCPHVPGKDVRHWGLPDPAGAEGSEEQRLDAFRKVRDEIKIRVKDLIESV
ncbi:arsenate reductase ArsC [Thermosediminibacter oceani]|uniref:Protein-tyrosine phosphatase, low molecular weight n=1 Tax=Thermosediminibacter oceani (strain ATCC BAA-1034 / DSM 16646 / JW/IW-1228P) TaxID=555079 RepID=D9S1S1_THEOJ|nr:Protein-tyrosine phosphatase, low molecular weight [Thermosediminibacter oceani DSM 16646]